MGSDREVFTVDDLARLSRLVIETWESGADRDWSVAAGTLDWNCRKTARHVIDTTFAPALFLASRRQRAYPPFEELRMTPGATVADLVDGLRTATNVLVGVILAAEPATRAIIRRFPVAETAGPPDFAPRGALEMIIHTYDIATGLDVAFDPPQDLCGRLFAHSEQWPRERVELTGDHWSDLLASRGRPRPA